MLELGFDDLRLFTRIATLGTLSAAARERNVPVSQVSRALSRIERQCGAQLVHRSTHGLSLSPEGQTLLAHGLALVDGMDELAAAFDQHSGQARGRVRVAASSVVAQCLLLPSLPGLHARHPQLQIDLQVSDQLADLAREGIDIAIRTATQLLDHQVARPLGELARALYAAPAYLAQHGQPQQPDDLHQHLLVTHASAPHLNQWPFRQGEQVHSLAVQGHWRSSDTGTTAQMVLAGLGIGRLAELVAAPLVAQGRLVPVLADWVDREPTPIYAVMAASRQRLPKVRACLDWWGDWFRAPGAAPAATPADHRP